MVGSSMFIAEIRSGLPEYCKAISIVSGKHKTIWLKRWTQRRFRNLKFAAVNATVKLATTTHSSNLTTRSGTSVGNVWHARKRASTPSAIFTASRGKAISQDNGGPQDNRVSGKSTRANGKTRHEIRSGAG